jgi:hypothetical protein
MVNLPRDRYSNSDKYPYENCRDCGKHSRSILCCISVWPPGDGFRRHADAYKATAVVKYRAVPTSLLAKIKPANELRYSREEMDALIADMRENGWKFPPGYGGQDIIVYVDWYGASKIGEGNHRLYAAIRAGLPTVPVEVRYRGRSDEQYLIWPFDINDPHIRVVED